MIKQLIKLILVTTVTTLLCFSAASGIRNILLLSSTTINKEEAMFQIKEPIIKFAADDEEYEYDKKYN